jgi:hypothetical protein
MGIDSNSIYSLSTCQQIDVYAQVRSHFVDRGHSVVLVPNWLEDAINSRPPEDIAKCIANSGNDILDELSKNTESQRELSLMIHALIYKAYNSNLLIYPEAKELLDKAICDYGVYYSYELTSIDYVATFNKVPKYIGDKDVEERMLSEICE